MTCKYFMISNVRIIVNNSYHLDMNYLLTYYFIDSPLYQRRKCRHMYIYIYVSFFQDTHVSHWFPRPAKPLYLIKWRNHCTYAWSESTLFNIFSAKMQKCEIFCIFITIQFKWPISIWCVFFHRSDSIFISDAMLQGLVGGGLGFFYAVDGLAYTMLFSHLLPYQEVQCITWLCLTLSLHLNGISKIFIVNDRSTEYINKNSSLMSAKVDYELQTKDLKIAFNRLHDK